MDKSTNIQFDYHDMKLVMDHFMCHVMGYVIDTGVDVVVVLRYA